MAKWCKSKQEGTSCDWQNGGVHFILFFFFSCHLQSTYDPPPGANYKMSQDDDSFDVMEAFSSAPVPEELTIQDQRKKRKAEKAKEKAQDK
jgi:hypothetical protein